jgi:hypothetical protein
VAGLLAGLGIVVGLVLLIVPGLVLMTGALTIPVVVLEGSAAGTAGCGSTTSPARPRWRRTPRSTRTGGSHRPGERRAELYRWRHVYPERYGGAGVKNASDVELAGRYDRIDSHLAGREGASRGGLVGDHTASLVR